MNIIDYVRNNKKTFNEVEFNEVDSLVLSTLVYIEFNQFVGSIRIDKLTVKGLAGNLKCLLKELQKSNRFSDITVSNYESIVDGNMQFRALTYRFDNYVYVAFSGSDSSVISWKENFLLSYMFPTLTQNYAYKYLKRTVKFRDKNILVGGHSKGGNLAIASIILASKHLQSKVRKIYSFDAPGFMEYVVTTHNYQNIKDKITIYVPEESIIGMLLYSSNYLVVKAKYFNILEHSTFTWLVLNNEFIKAKLSKRSITLKEEITKRLEKMPINDRLVLINKLFSIFKDNNINDFKDIKISNVYKIVKSFKELDEETQDLIIDLFITLFIK